MFDLTCAISGNREPWLIPLELRRSMARDALRAGMKLTILMYDHADTSTFRYRCYNVQQATENSKQWRSVYFFMNELETVIGLLPRCSLLVFVRLKWIHLLDSVVHKARRYGVPVLFDIDDYVCDVQYLKLVTNTLNVHFGSEVDYDFWFAYCSRLEYTARMCDGFITTNDYLGQMLTRKFDKPYGIIMNSLNQEQCKVSLECAQEKSGVVSRRPFTIGYFSGTPSHINDFRTVHVELTSLLEDYPDMMLQVVGFMEFPPSMRHLIESKRIVFKPLVDFLELQRMMAEVDVSIVPLVQNKFTNCKSELKFFEGAAVDTVTLATPTYTYTKAIHPGETGYLCEPGRWYEHIEKLYRHPDISKRIAAAAKAYCLKRYTGEAFLAQIEETYGYFAK